VSYVSVSLRSVCVIVFAASCMFLCAWVISWSFHVLVSVRIHLMRYFTSLILLACK